MTNEEAIKWIERFELAFPLPIEDYIDAKEALDMAIKALEQVSSYERTIVKLTQAIAEGANEGTYEQGYADGWAECLDHAGGQADE